MRPEAGTTNDAGARSWPREIAIGVGAVALLASLLLGDRYLTSPPFGPLVDADFRAGASHDPTVVELGRLLFFDPELSGNRNISCATCHHPLVATTDGLSLPIGEGGVGLGPARTPGEAREGAHGRVARNAPALFNLGAREFRALYHDGRVAADPGAPSGFATPAGDYLPGGLDSVVAAQAMFPPTLATEMAGQPDDNEIARAVHAGRLAGSDGAWELLARRLRAIPDYVRRFVQAFDDVRARDDITFVHAANALAAFQESAFRSHGSPFDHYLGGDTNALSAAQLRGMRVFYGEGRRCSRCHTGPLLTDQAFHSIAMPQVGPGTGDGFDGRDDHGRARTTGRRGDRYRFRTPSLRNVELTGPWGHDGAYGSLEAMVRHYRDMENNLVGYDPGQLVLPSRPDLDRHDLALMRDPVRVAAIAASSEARSLPLVQMSNRQVDDLVAFLRALTDPGARDLGHLVPDSVPSGRPVATIPRAPSGS